MIETLREFGWVDGKTMEVVFPKATQDLKALAGNMQQLLAAKVDLIVAQTKPAIIIAKNATSDIPIVMGALNGDPVKEGFVKSLQRPGGNITGTYYNVTARAGGRVSVLAELVPSMQRIGIVFNPDSDLRSASSGERPDEYIYSQVLHTGEVSGSIPVARTNLRPFAAPASTPFPAPCHYLASLPKAHGCSEVNFRQ